MLLDICLGTRSAWKILLLLAEAPGKNLTRTQIKKHTKIGNKVLIKSLLLFQKQGIIEETKRGRQYFYKLNLVNPFIKPLLELIKTEKKEHNAVYFQNILIIREFIYELTNFNLEPIQKIILFGSVAKHTAQINSDIDLAIIHSEKISPGEQLLYTNATEKIEKRFGKTVQTHYFTQKEFQNLLKSKNKLAIEIITDGITLMGNDA